MTFIAHPQVPRVKNATDAEHVADSPEEFRWLISSNEAAFLTYGWPDDELEPFHAEMAFFMRHYNRTLILLPAGGGKTTIDQRIAVMEIRLNPNNRLAIVLKSDDDTSGPGQEMVDMLSDPQPGETDTPRKRLFDLFGSCEPRKKGVSWNTSQLNVSGRQIQDVSFTLRWFGVGGPMLGYRTFRTIMDDCISEKNSGTDDAREKVLTWYNRHVQRGPDAKWNWNPDGTMHVPDKFLWTPPHLGPDGNLYPVAYPALNLTGTRFDIGDLYGQIINRKVTSERFRYHILVYDCWVDENRTVSFWPKKWPPEDLLAEEESMGEYDFNCRMRNNPVSRKELVFPTEVIEGKSYEGITYPGCLGDNISHPKHSIGEFDEKWLRVLTFDPASGKQTTKTSWPSWVLFGWDQATDTDYWIEHFRDKIGYTKMQQIMLGGIPGQGQGFFSRFHYQVLVIEGNAYGVWMTTDENFGRELEERNVWCVAHDTQREGTQKWDPISGVKARCEKRVTTGKLILPYYDEFDRKSMREPLHQFKNFPKGAHDFVMCYWFYRCAIELYKGGRGSAQVDPEFADQVEWVELPRATRGPRPAGEWLT